MKKMSIKSALNIFKVLADNEYSLIWEVVEDFEVNGHVVSVQRSNRRKHVIIDNTYVSIEENVTTHVGDNRYEGLEYVEYRLAQ